MTNNTPNQDDVLVYKVMTFKSGKFIFSRKYDKDKLLDHLIRSEILYSTIKDLPILPELSTRLEEEIIRKSIFGTAAIEGNLLSEEKVAQIISDTDTTKLTETAEKEIKNLKKAYDYFVTVKHVPGVIFKLEEDQIKKIHRIITDGLGMKNNMPGLYRSHPVFVGNREHGGVYRPPKNLADIESLMKEFVTWLNSEEILSLVPEIRAALAHYHFALIHPFGNGNGRTARIIEALILTAADMKYMPVMLSNFYYKHIDEYFSVFSSSEQNAENDITPFLKFVLKGVVESLNNIKDNIIYFIRIFTLRDYYAFLHKEKFITQRQYDFLIMLLENMKTFSLSDLSNVSPFNVLYRTVSERTVRRDLHKLCDRSLLICEKDKYELNLRVIG